MALTRLDNLYSSKTGRYLYVSPDDFNATDELDNRGNSPLRPFKTIQRAFIEVARYSYLPGRNNDRFDQFSIMLMPGNHYIDNRPGVVGVTNTEPRYLDGANLIEANRQEIIDRAFGQIAIEYDESLWGIDWVVPGDPINSDLNRGFDSYRLIQQNRSDIIDDAFAAMLAFNPGFIVPNGDAKCKRDIGYFIDAVSLDILLGGGNKYTRKFIQNYFNSAGTAWLANTLEGEQSQSIQAFNAAKDLMNGAVTNQLAYKDLTLTIDPVTGSNTNINSCANIRSAITSLTTLVTDRITANSLNGLPSETSGLLVGPGQSICQRDIGYIVDGVIADLKTGGNSNSVQSARSYFDRNGQPISNGLIGEESQSVIAFNAAKDMMKKAVTNQLYSKDLTLLEGPSIANSSGEDQPILASGNELSCVDVQNTIETLVAIITGVITDGNLNSLADIQITGDVPVFNYSQALEEWNDNSILDLSNPDNVLYKFNAASGGAIVPRGCSLIGYDLRRTIVRPLYVPDPADGTQTRTSIFNLTGGCYIWQFTIKDGDLSSNSPLFDEAAGVGKVYFQKGNTVNLAIPEYSHHKITIMTYADGDDLGEYYTKVARAFAKFQPSIDNDGEFNALVQENRIVGPLSDTRRIDSIQVFDSDPAGTLRLRVTTKIDHGYFVDQYIAILNTGLDESINGTVKVTAIDSSNPRVFEYIINATTAALGLVSGQIYTAASGLNTNAVSQAEIDSVESASPYVFNCSIRSTWGLCGMWADGSKATGFKSMVVAQYTGVSLQKDDRAFIRYDRFTNTWNQASLTDAFATVPYHTKGDAYWKDDWRNFHIRASDDSFVQCVSVFAVGFFDHFLMESGGDMSITNSNSNFGNTSLHAIGFKGFSFNQDKGGYITDIIPPRTINTSPSNEEKTQYYTLDIQASNAQNNHTRLYIGSDDATDPADRPAATVNGYRIGAKTNEKIYVKLDDGTYNATIEPNGFVTYKTSLETLNPAGIQIDNVAQDAANRIEDNKQLIQNESYNYIINKYPYLLTRQSITIAKCERDIGYFVDAVIQDLRLGGNVNTVQAAEGYYVGGSLAYINSELDETIEALDYVKNMCIAAMRNFDVLIRNCETESGSAIVNVGDTTGLVIGMSVAEYTPANFTNNKLNTGVSPIITNIPSNTYIKRILDDQRIELGESSAKLTVGNAINALQTSTTAYLYFDYQFASWAGVQPSKDDSLIQDTNYPECADVASTISQYFSDISVIINQGITPLGGREIDAHNLILANKELIAEVAVDRMLTNYPGFIIPNGNQNCVDDIIDVMEAIAFNVKYGGNNKVYEAGEIYISGQHVEGEEDQAVYAFLQARDIAIQAMRNEPIAITGSTLTQVIDPTIVVDPSTPKCANVATAITNLTSIITQSIGTSSVSGSLVGITKSIPTITSVNKIEPIIDFAGLSKRATLFTIDTGSGTSNPHQFETGTPVKLVPKAKPFTNPDKRVIRLPKGFSTNTKYYVIAPGRFTQPEDYSGTTYFDGSDQTKLMLAATKENAAAGIFIYSPETDSVDPDVEIEVQRYVLDNTYDLHKYRCNIAGAGEIETDVAHTFDLPSASVTPQLVFFRIANDILGSDLPEIAGAGTISTQTYYYARFISPKKFSIHTSYSDAIAGVNAVSFVPGSGQDFYVFSNKRTSPLRFEASPTDEDGLLLNTSGLWYLQVKDETSVNPNTESILYRFKDIAAYGPGSGKIRTLDTWFTRLQDAREKEDRVYRLRYVIPKYLETVRDPLNGFVIKVRTDDKRRLIPQKFVLKPIGGAPTVARFDNPEQIGERIGYTTTELLDDYGIANATYDPYLSPKVIGSDRTESKIAFSIQSAKKIIDLNNPGDQYLEITAFDHTITNEGLKNEIFSVVKINFPQGGTFTVNNVGAGASNLVTWSGFSNGSGYIQGYFEENGNYYLVLKNITGELAYNSIVNTRFTQEDVFADLLTNPNSMGDPTGKDKSNRRDYLYRIEGANVYTLSPGDVITDDANNQYTIENLRDAGNLEDSFYIFDIDTIQERIAGQQDGIYYLTCLRGNISPFPTGAGVGTNFRNFKFSQPISQLYPQNYKNDPVWFKQVNSVYNDPPASIAAADNYVHGLVTINDAKNSETKELVQDFILQPALVEFNFVNAEDLSSPSLNPIGGSNIIEAQEGNATSGSEDRYIPIAGDSDYPTEGKLYVELRRPSIARSGNHTFEYLGFGPGNYSTGFPLRQEVVLSDIQDFYAQSKRENGGIVFYTGLNSNGDLYIGNRKVNAITGEETFLERAALEDSADDSGDNLGGLVTTFDTPVTFNDRITVEGNANFNNPVEISVAADEGTPLRIFSVVNADLGDDITVGRQQFARSNDGDITLGKNRINSAIYGITPRQVLGLSGQAYSIRTHFVNGLGPSNTTPNQNGLFSSLQVVSYSSIQNPVPGDILLKGGEVGRTGSLGWIYANYYSEIADASIQTIVSDGIRIGIEWAPGITNADVNVVAGSQLRITNFGANPNLNGIWTVLSNGFNPNGVSCQIQIVVTPAVGVLYTWSTVPAAKMEVGRSNWKETGLLGAEALRTETETWGDYKLGINTLSRASDLAYLNAFAQSQTEPRANLDVVGDAFISGTNTAITVSQAGNQTKTTTKLDNALLVGGNSASPNQAATLRVSTLDIALGNRATTTYREGGRFGINTTINTNISTDLDRNLVVVGDGRITGNLLIQDDISVNGGDINTTNNVFNFVNNDATVLNIAGDGEIFSIGNNTNNSQNVNIGNTAATQVIEIGGSATITRLGIHKNSLDASVDIASVNDASANNAKIVIGGAWGNLDSQTTIGTFQTKIAGQLEIGTKYAPGTSTSRIFTQTRTVNIFDGDQTNTVNFATNATTLSMGSVGGNTYIRNTLNVDASAIFNSEVRLSGGLKSGIIKIARGRFSTTPVAHTVGGLENPNIDFYKYLTLGRAVDTAGVTLWGGPSFLIAGGQITGVDNVSGSNPSRLPGVYTFVNPSGGTGVGAVFNITVTVVGEISIELVSSGSGYTDNDLLTVTDNLLGGGGAPALTFQVNGVNAAGSNFYLPITTPATTDFAIGDLILLDRGNSVSPDVIGDGSGGQLTGLRNEAYSEIVRVVGLTNVSNPSNPNGYRIEVVRGQEGTQARTDHPDDCVLAKLNKQANASFITGSDLDNDGVLEFPPQGILGNGNSVNIGVAEFGGVITTNDYFRLSDAEIVKVAEVISTEIQSLIVTDGGFPESEVFRVESTTGNTRLIGNLSTGFGYNQFTVDGSTGNTNIAGTLTTNGTLTLRGSTVVNNQFFTITNGGATGVTERTTLQVDTATGNLTMNGGSINIFGTDGTTPRLTFNNSSGDFVTYGSFSALGTGTSTFGGDLLVQGDGTFNGGDLTVNTGGSLSFKVSNDKSVTVAGIPYFFNQNGGAKWIYTDESVVDATPNVNVFINALGNTLIKLPTTARMGDMIRIVDVGGNLNNITSIVLRAPDGVRVQGTLTNTARTLLAGVGGSSTFINYNGGELVVQTPFAGFALVYLSNANPDGTAGGPASKVGWYLTEV
jgi:hypothetical protein